MLVDDSEEELEIVEKEKTLEELFRQEREEADEVDRGERGESAIPEATQALLRLRADRLDSPDPLLENDRVSVPSFSTTAFAHRIVPQTLSPTRIRSVRSATPPSPTTRATSFSASSATCSATPTPSIDRR